MINVRLQQLAGLAAAVSAAERSGLLAALLERPGSAEDLAARCSLDSRACARVLELLEAFSLSVRDGRCYRAGSELADLASRPLPLGRMEAELWLHAPAFLRTGKPVITMDAAPAEREDHYRDVVSELAKLFSAAADQLADRCGLTPQSILDIGCGSGVWSLALARRVPAARVTGLDLPAVLNQFRARAATFGLSDRVTTIAGDMHSVPLPQGQWELAIIANVLRLEPVATARSLVARGAAALQAGGSLLIIDALAAGTTAARQARAVYAFHLALRTQQGRVHSAAEISEWMAEAGCETPVELAFDDRFVEAGALGALIARKARL